MIFVKDHAAYAYIDRFLGEETLTTVKESLVLLALKPDKVIRHDKHPEIFAYICGQVVLIIREMGKDQMVITVEDLKEKEFDNWWRRIGGL